LSERPQSNHKSAKPRCFGSGVLCQSKKHCFFDNEVCGLTASHAWRTFASRAVFSPPYTPPKKMIGLSFAASAAKLYEVFGQAAPPPLLRQRGFVTLRNFLIV
jgi:hypothetical protein